MAGPGDERAAAHGQGRGELRASHADREQVIEVLKAAFAQGRLTKDELDARAGQALSARTYAELAGLTADLLTGPADLPAALTADVPVGPADFPAGPAAPGPPRTARTLATAARRSGICLLATIALIEGAVLDNNLLLLILAAFAFMAAYGFLGYGVVDWWQERRSRAQLPPGEDRRGLEAGQPGRVGHDPAPPGTRAERTRADVRAHRSRPGRRPSSSGPRARAPRGIRPVPGAV